MATQSIWQPTAPTGGDAPGSNSGTTAQTVGTKFSVSQSATLTNVCFYSDPTTVSTALNALPTWVGLFSTSGTLLASNASPSWSGAVKSGWISTTIPSYALTAGTSYIVAVSGGDDSSAYWSDYTYGYFGSGSTGANGITAGIITVPGDATTANQGWYTHAANSFPSSQYADANWWIDVIVSTSSGLTSSGSAHAAAFGLSGSGSVGAHPKIATLTDAFPGSSLNASNWYVEPVNGGSNNGLPSGTVTVSGGKLSLTGGIDSGTNYYTSVNSQNAYDLTGSSVFVHLFPNTSSTDYDTGFDLVNQAITSGLSFGVTGGNLYIEENNNGSFSTLFTLAYDATNHAWLKVSEASGVITLSTSPDSVTWISRKTITTETVNTWTASASYVQMFYGSNLGTAKPAGTASFADFNVAGVTGITSTGSAATAAPTFTGSGSVVIHVTSTGSLALASPAFTGVVSIVAPGTATLRAGTLGVSGTGTVVYPPDPSTGSLQLPARTFTGNVTVANPVASTGSLGLGSRGMAATAFNAPPILTTGSFRMADRGFTGAVAPASFDPAPAGPPLPLNPLKPQVELFLRNSQTWLDVSSRVFYDTVNLAHGGPDESTQTTAAQFTGTMDNSDGNLSTLNPSSPYYGQLGLNTPLRVSIPDGSNSMLCEGVGADYASTPSATALNPTGDFEIWLDADLDNWYSSQVLAGKWTSGSQSWVLRVSEQGIIEFEISTGGSGASVLFSATASPVPIRHGRMSIRLMYQHATCTTQMFIGQYCSNWVSISNSTVGSSQTVFASTAPITVGSIPNYTEDTSYTGMQGRVYAFALISGNNNTPSSAGLCLADMTQVGVGSTTFTDAHSNTWTLNGTATITDRNYRFYGEASAWPQSWSVGDPNARVTITASGLLRRYGNTNAPVMSPMRRAYSRELLGIAGVAPVSYWPMEETPGATALGSAIPGQPPLQAPNPVSVGNDSTFISSLSLPLLNGGSIYGSIPAYTPGTGNANGTIVRFLFAQGQSGEAAGTILAQFNFTGGTVSAVTIVQNGTGGGVTYFAYDNNGNVIGSPGPGFWSSTQVDPSDWSGQCSLEYVHSPTTGQVQIYMVVVPVGDGTITSLGSAASQIVAPMTGTVGRLTSVTFGPSAALPVQNTAIGHLVIQTQFTTLYNMETAVAGYPNEKAGRRFQRLCNEEGITFRSIGNLDDTVPMGAQSIETLVQLLQECVDADQGIWYEPRQVLGWGFRTRASLQNQPVSVTFDYSKDQLSGSLEPTIDDQVLKNDVTVTSQQGGSSARATLDDGSPTSIGVVGRYDVQNTVNVPNSGLASAAGWQLWSLSRGDPRYTEIDSDLANLGLDTAVYYGILGLEVGDRIQIINVPVWLPPGPVDQLIKGRTEVISEWALSYSWNTIPNSPYLTMVFDDATFGILEGPYSVLSL